MEMEPNVLDPKPTRLVFERGLLVARHVFSVIVANPMRQPNIYGHRGRPG